MQDLTSPLLLAARFEAIFGEAAPDAHHWCAYHCPAVMASKLALGFERHLRAQEAN